MLKWEKLFSIQSVFQQIKFWLGVSIGGSVKKFCSSKVETFLPHYLFFRIFDAVAIILCRTFQLQHKFSLISKDTRLTFVCEFSWESTPLLLSRVAKFFPVTKSVAVRRAVAFYVQAKKAWEWKKKLQKGWNSILPKLLVLIFSSSEITEKYNLAFSEKFPIFWTNSFFVAENKEKSITNGAVELF